MMSEGAPYDSISHTPMRFILGVFLLIMLMGSFALWQLHHKPWLGFEVESVTTGLRIVQVYDNGPAVGLLRPGDILTSAKINNFTSVKLDGVLLQPEPHELHTYQQVNDLVYRHDQLARLLKAGSVTFRLADGRSQILQPAKHRPVSSTPSDFWLQQLFGIVVLMIGVGVWSFRRRDLAASIFALTGLGLYIAAWCSSLVAVRGLAIPGDYFQMLLVVKDVGNFLFAINCILLLYQFPRGRHMGLFIGALYTLLLLVMLNEAEQFIELPVHAYQIHYHLLLLIGIGVSFFQWKRTAGMPLERSVLRWVLLSVFGSLALLFALYLVPILILTEPLVSYNVGDAIMVLMYVGMAIGVARYRIFDLERWWVTACLWLLGGLLVASVDVLLMMLLEVNAGLSAGVAVAIAGWLYFPVRQQLLRYFIKDSSRSSELMSELLEHLYTAVDDKDIAKRWEKCLSRLFSPQHISSLPEQITHVSIRNDGLCLAVPLLLGGGALELSCADRGNHLFSQTDQHMVQSIWSVARRVLQQRQAHEQGAKEERKRIMRDLHDDVAARLLTLIHRADSESGEKRARSTLKALRDVIYSLDDDSVPPLSELLLAWQFDVQERVGAAGIVFAWRQPALIPDFMMRPRQRINLTRMLHEAISNAITHASPEHICIAVEIEHQFLQIAISDDGRSAPFSCWVAGKGLNHIRTRAEEIHATVAWHQPARIADCQHGCTLEIKMPLHEPVMYE